jgi:hypothetical protein
VHPAQLDCPVSLQLAGFAMNLASDGLAPGFSMELASPDSPALTCRRTPSAGWLTHVGSAKVDELCSAVDRFARMLPGYDWLRDLFCC